jgi:hypothetical protein
MSQTHGVVNAVGLKCGVPRCALWRCLPHQPRSALTTFVHPFYRFRSPSFLPLTATTQHYRNVGHHRSTEEGEIRAQGGGDLTAAER